MNENTAGQETGTDTPEVDTPPAPDASDTPEAKALPSALDALDNLLDATLDDLEDLPEFTPFKPGAHKVTASFEEKEKAAAKRVAAGGTEYTPLELAVTGKNKLIWEGQFSLQLPVLKEKKGSNPAKYYLYTETVRGIPGCSKFTVNLEKKHPAHLGQLLKKIRDNQPKL